MATLTTIIPMNMLDYSIDFQNFQLPEAYYYDNSMILFSYGSSYTEGYFGTYNFQGNVLTSGTLTSYYLTQTTSPLNFNSNYISVTGLNADVVQLANYAANLNTYAVRSTLFAGNDRMTLAGYDDAIAGYLGSDTIDAGGGNDLVYGGRSIADAEDTADLIIGGLGNDNLFGNYGNDTIYGGNETSSSLDGGDVIYGGRGQDLIFGDAGNDSLYGGGGIAHPADEADEIFGEAGNDYILGNGGDDWIYGGSGNDTIYGGLGADRIVFDNGGGVDAVAGIDVTDIAYVLKNINGTNITDFTTLMARATATDYGTYFDLGGGNGVQAYGLTPAEFNSASFIFFDA